MSLGNLEILVLVRLLAPDRPGAQTVSPGRLQRDLARLVPGADAKASLGEACERLLAGDLVARQPRGSLLLTSAGRARALDHLGVASIPSPLSWARLRDGLLMRRLLAEAFTDERAGTSLGKADALQAAILRVAYGLGHLPADATLARVRNAAVWSLLGVCSDRPVTANAVVQEVLLKQIAPDARVRTGAKATAMLAACLVGAPRTGGDELRRSLLRRWLAARPPVRTPNAPRPHRDAADGARPTVSAPPSLEELAAMVLESAAEIDGDGRFGPDKVFISYVWQRLRQELEPRGVDEHRFKAQLAAANNRRLLNLSRADLVEAMDPAAVAASATPYLDATFHFVRL